MFEAKQQKERQRPPVPSPRPIARQPTSRTGGELAFQLFTQTLPVESNQFDQDPTLIESDRSRSLSHTGFGLPMVQWDTEVATSSGTDQTPLVNSTAYDWVHRHGAQLVRELATQLESSPLTLPVAEMRWRGGQSGFVRSLLAPLAGDGSLVWSLLPSYLRPD